MRHLAAVLVIGLALPGAAFAQAGLLVPTSVGRPDPKTVSLREMRIDAEIVRGYARVNVRQVFENHTDQPQEGTYRFALPPSAAVGDFAVWDGLVRIPGIIFEKRRARAIYRDLATQRIDPGILQQGEEADHVAGEAPTTPSGGALFSVTVSPIPPRATKRLEIQFHQEIPLVGGLSELRLALKPQEGSAPLARTLAVNVKLGDGVPLTVPAAMPLTHEQDMLSFSGRNVALDKDLVVRFQPPPEAPLLRLSAFRNPEGRLPDGLALAPWERAAEIPPEKDGFFLLEYQPRLSEANAEAAKAASERARRPGGTFVFVFDTSLSQRFVGLEASYATLVEALGVLRPDDRFALIAFDQEPDATATLVAAERTAIDGALARLRERSLAPGTNVVAALRRAREVGGPNARIVLLTDGEKRPPSAALREAAGSGRLFTAIGGAETPESFRNASAALLPPNASGPERQLFLQALLEGGSKAPASTSAPGAAPFSVRGGEPQIRDVYPVLRQPAAPGALSGWVGRYAVPGPKVQFALAANATVPGVPPPTLDTALPEVAFEARDLPRRWARARVDDLLRRIEAEGEKREWIEEIIDLSRRYKFVTPYTAYLAAPRALLRPRRIQPGDPVLRVECDPRTVSATALLPFGLRLPLARRPKTNVWEGRFLVPPTLKDGRYNVRILIKDVSGAIVSESKAFVVDGTAPRVTPEIPPAVGAGDDVRIAARADDDVVILTARFGDGAKVPLRWDPSSKKSVGFWRVPAGAAGKLDVLFEAMDAAKNHAFVRATVEVRP